MRPPQGLLLAMAASTPLLHHKGGSESYPKVALALALHVTTSFNLSQTTTRTRRNSKRQRVNFYPLCMTADPTREHLQQLTVKVLRDQLKLIQPPIKLSNLKLKSDMIDCLLQHYSTSDLTTQKTIENNTLTTTLRRPSLPTRVLKMPAIPSDIPSKKNTASPKDVIFEQVFKRYPPLRELHSLSANTNEPSLLSSSFTHPSAIKSFSGLGDFDIRQVYHPILSNITSSDFDAVMVGTASCVPGVTRGVSCTALRLQWRRTNNERSSESNNNMNTAGIWIFDCGESTQLQVQRTSSIRPGKITKIFITHCHGDHSFGLPGLLCLMGQDRDREGPPLDIYGPQGLRMWLRTAIRYSVSRIVPPYRVHEIMDVPMAPEWLQGRNIGRYYYGGRQAQREQSWRGRGLAGEDPVSWISHIPQIDLEPSIQFGEVSGGRDIYPDYQHALCVDGAPVWEVENVGDVKVYAAPMSHGVPCVGYVVEEESKTGRLRSELVEPILMRNLEALKQEGMKAPMKMMAKIKDLPQGGSYTFPDGTTVYRDDVVEPPIKGRKVVVCGDTADARALTGLAKGADLLIHEATNAFLSGIDKDTSQEEVTHDAKIHGHSTPFMAGDFAKRIGAKRLLLTHFSSRYKGDQSLESMSIMTRIEKQAIQSSGLPEDRVAAAWDLMVLPIPRNNI